MGQRLIWPNKYNSEKPTNGVNWAPKLAAAEVIQSATFTAIDGSDVTFENIAFTDTTSSCKVVGGAVGTHWVLAAVVTNGSSPDPLEEICVFEVLRESVTRT